jgi:PPP family 3-phenylpropionic acid transporter
VPLFLLPAVTRKIEKTAEKPADIHAGKKIISFYFIIGFMLIFASRFSMVSFYTFFPLYLTEVIGWNAIGLMYALSAGSEIPFILFSDRIVRRFGALPLLAFSTAAVCVRLLLLAFFTVKAVFIGAQLLHALCYGVFHPAAINFISRVFPPEKRGLGMSIYLALGTGLPTLIGNMAGGGIVEAAGYRFLLAIYAAVSGAAVILYCLFRKKATEA